MNWRIAPLTIIRLPVFFMLVAVGTKGVTETDIWGHMRFGLDLIATRTLPSVDRYSFTGVPVWVNHEWLSDLFFGVAYATGGLPLIAALRAALVAGTLIILAQGIRAVAWPLRDLLLVAFVIPSLPLLGAVRPQVFSAPLYALTLVALSRDAAWLPLVFAVWANLHGGWLLGLGAVMVRTVLEPSRRRFLILFACAAATLATPYRFLLWLSLADAIRRGWNTVAEWQPVWNLAPGPAELILYCILAGITAWAAFKRVAATRWQWVWTTCVAIAAFRVRRHVPFFSITVILLVLSRIRVGGWDVSKASWSPQAAMILAVPVLCAGYFAAAILGPTVSCLPSIQPPVRPESDVVRFIRSADLRGRMLMWFDWGLYSVWHVGDRLRVSIDNRRETVYSAQTVFDHWEFYAGRDPDYPDRIAAHYAWLPVGLPPVAQLESRGWYVIYRGPRSVILSRTYLPLTHQTLDTIGKCFPDP